MLKEILKKQLVRNSFINLTARITVLCISTVFLGYLCRQINKFHLGIFASLFIFQGLVVMIGGLGLSTSAIRLIPEFSKKKDFDKVSDIIKITLLTSASVFCALTVFGTTSAKLLSRIFFKSDEFADFLKWILAISFFYNITQIINLIHQSLQQFIKLAYLSLFTNISQRLIAVILLIYGFGLRGVLIGFFLGALMGTISGVLTLSKHLFSRYNGYPISEYINFSIPYYFQSLSRLMFFQTDQMLVALLFNPQTLAVYFIAKKLVFIITSVFEGLLEPVIPKLSEIKFQGISIFKTNMQKAYRGFALLMFVAVILFSFNSKNLIFWLGGIGYINDYVIVILLSISMFFYGIFSLVGIGLYLLETPFQRLMISLVVGITNLISGLAFGSMFGLIGFAFAQSIGFALGILLIRVSYKDKWLDYIWKKDLFWVSILIGCVLISYLLNENFATGVKSFSSITAVLTYNAFIILSFAYLLKKYSIYVFS